MDRQKLKTEGPKISSNYIFYFKTVIIGGPILHALKARKAHDAAELLIGAQSYALQVR